MGRIVGLDIELEAEVLLRNAIRAGVVSGERSLIGIPLNIDLAIAAGHSRAVDIVRGGFRIGNLNRPRALVLAVNIEVIIGLAVILSGIRAQNVAAVLREGEGTIRVFLDLPDQLGVRIGDLAVGRRHVDTGDIVAAHLAGKRLAVARVVENDLVAVLQRSGLDVLVAGRLQILAQLRAAAVAEAVLVFVDMTQSRKLLGLGLAALRAGVGLDALFRAGRLGRDDAVVPRMVAGGRGVRSLAGRGLHIIRDVLTENQPRIFRIVDEDVAVALNGLRLVVAGHFPRVDRVALAPLEQGVKALDDL